jgi:hypothetical protein
MHWPKGRAPSAAPDRIDIGSTSGGNGAVVAGETLIYCHPGKNQHEKRKARFPLSFIFSALQAPKMAARPCAAGNAE